MRINQSLIFLLTVAAYFAPVKAETVLMYEDFNSDYTKSVGYTLDADQCDPNKAIASIFYSNMHNACMPWWYAKDSRESKDQYAVSHSYYSEPNESEDWMIMKSVEIDTKGYVLEFDAQSLPIRSLDKLSDLCIFITEDLLDVNNIPDTPTKIFEKIPYGKDPDLCEGDWTHYTMSLDEWEGKKIYVNFVNRNDDKDILCIDNVKISRDDKANIKISDIDTFTIDTSCTASLNVTPAYDEAIDHYVVTLNIEENGVVTPVQTWEGNLAAGQELTFTGEVPLNNPGAETRVFFTFGCDGQSWLQTAEESVTRMAFEPVHRIFIEETTSLHCGNCPMGMYTVESLLNDEEYGDRFIPVSVHIAAMGYDPMANSDYYSKLPKYDAAPLVYIDRFKEYDGFIPAYDLEFDTSNPQSFAYRIARRIDSSTFLDVDVSAEWEINGTDTTGVKCTAKVIPAIDIKEGDFRVAFILTENNVGLDNNRYWIQDNYLSGADTPGNIGGWKDLPKYVANARFHDVARSISSYDGHPKSLPSDMTTGEEYTFTYTMDIPDTENIMNGMLVSKAIQHRYCQITAIVIENYTGMVVNAARVDMSPEANERVSMENLAGIDSVISDSGKVVDTEYYDINGRRISRPGNGFYIQRDIMSDGTSKSRVKH